jgi:uncharacterized protein
MLKFNSTTEANMQKKEEREPIVLENHGQKIFGIIHRPIQTPKYPALLMCHGLGGQKSGKYRLYVALAVKLAENGIAALRIDFRGSGDSEGEFSEMTLDGEVSDALKGLDFLLRDPCVDSSKVGLFGRSVGGAVAVMAARRSGQAKSLVVWAPIFSGNQWIDKWNTLHTQTLSETHRTEMMRINGQVPGYAFFQQLFSLRMEEELVALDKTAMLHIHGEKDAQVAIEHADQYMRLRQKSLGQTKFIRLPNSDHDFSYYEEQQIAIQETCKWLIQTL